MSHVDVKLTHLEARALSQAGEHFLAGLEDPESSGWDTTHVMALRRGLVKVYEGRRRAAGVPAHVALPVKW
jgi:hypothetical protein